VDPAWRHRGIGRALLGAGEAWGREQRCRSFVSDVPLADVAAQALHHALGFRTTAPLLHYHKPLMLPPAPPPVVPSR
jgi:aminoglycoside 6'-N-acetyltransferase I